jgi:hypothetical protein
VSKEPDKIRRGHGGKFAKGHSANPSGCPKGSRHKATLAAEALLDGEAEKLTRRAIDMALAGDTTALRICLDRILPPRRERVVNFALPPIAKAADIVAATAALARAVADGELTPGESAALSTLLGNAARAIEVSDLEERLAQLETTVAKGK